MFCNKNTTIAIECKKHVRTSIELKRKLKNTQVVIEDNKKLPKANKELQKDRMKRKRAENSMSKRLEKVEWFKKITMGD